MTRLFWKDEYNLNYLFFSKISISFILSYPTTFYSSFVRPNPTKTLQNQKLCD